jgi:hypothetical protein
MMKNKLYSEGREFVKWLGKTVPNKSTLPAPPFNKLSLVWRSKRGAVLSLWASPPSSSMGGQNGHKGESRGIAPQLPVMMPANMAANPQLLAGGTKPNASQDATLPFVDDDMRPERRQERYRNFKHKYGLVTVGVVCIPVLIPVLVTATRSTLEVCGSARSLPNDQPVGAGAGYVMASVCAMCGDNWPGFAMHFLFSCWWLLWFALFYAHGPSA